MKVLSASQPDIEGKLMLFKEGISVCCLLYVRRFYMYDGKRNDGWGENMFYFALGCISIVFVLVALISSVTIFRTSIELFDVSDKWIDFLGNLLGVMLSGIITLVVLVKTLESNRKSDAMHLIPCFSCAISRDGIEDGTCGGAWYIERKNTYPKARCDGETQQVVFCCKLKNVGLGTALNVSLEKVYSDQDDYYIEYNRMPIEKYTVACNTELELNIMIWEELSIDIRYWYLDLTFDDLLGNQYKQTVYYPLFLNDRSTITSPKRQ